MQKQKRRPYTFISKEVWNEIYQDHQKGMKPIDLMAKYSQHNLKEGTLYSKLSRMKKEAGEGKLYYTEPSHLSVGDRAKVIDGANRKDNGKTITITKVGKIFIEGVDEKKNPVAAYKVLKAKPESQLVQEVPQPAPSDYVETMESPALRPPKEIVGDEILWERKLIYDVQTVNHLYRVKVEKDVIVIVDGEGNEITIAKDRLEDIALILKNLPQLLQED